MKGNYITQEGEIREVVDFDEANKMAYVKVAGSQFKWYGEPEYLNWKKEGGLEAIEEEIFTEEPKKKKATTKKDKK